MLNVKLVSMPFAGLGIPSLALTQIKSVLRDRYREAVRVEICYLTLEFGKLLTPRAYDFVAYEGASQRAGFGEWLFSKAAFPNMPDNTDEYFRCHEALFRDHLIFTSVKDHLLQLRQSLHSILDDLIVRYRLDEADVVGLTSMFQQTCPSIALAMRLRARARGAEQVIAMGGANCEGTMGRELAANVPAIDFVFSGPSLISFPTFVDHLLTGRRESCHRIDGVFSRRNARRANEFVLQPAIANNLGMTVCQPVQLRELGTELDIDVEVSLDYDDYIEAQQKLLPELDEVSLTFETSRGCWWGERAHCTFCGLNGETMAYKAMTPARALALIRGLIERYHPRGIKDLQCVDNILAKEYVDGVFAQLEPPSDVRIFYEVKADLTDAQVATLARGGVRLMQPGIEALSTATLKLMRKGTTAFQNVLLLMYCARHGVVPIWNLLIGFPGEKREVYDAYLRVLPSLFHLCPPLSVFQIRFDRYSPYFTQAQQFGLQLEPFPYYEFCYPFTAAAIANIAYYFVDRNPAPMYATQAQEYLHRLYDLIVQWRECHRGKATRKRARLELLTTPDGAWIEDSRDGDLRTYELSDEEVHLLLDLRDPQPLRDIESSGRAKILDSLQQNRLLFSERDRFMSIVMVPDAARLARRHLQAAALS